MERKLKERLVGATVIVALGIIIIPWLLDGPAQAPRPVETAIELPPVESPGRTYTIPLDPGAGPAVEIDSEARQTNGAGTVQRPATAEPAPLDLGDADSAPAEAERPQQPPPRPAPQPAVSSPDPDPDTGAPVDGENGRPAQPAPEPAPQPAGGTAAQPPPSDAWSVQVGSFSQRDNAQALHKRLTAAGFAAFVSRVVTDAGTLYRVRVGPVPDRPAADRLLEQVRAAGHSGARAVRVED